MTGFMKISYPLIISAMTLLSCIAEQKKAPEGFISLFDGETLKGWHKGPRMTVDRYTGEDRLKPGTPQHKKLKEHIGKWEVVDKAITGGQEPAGSRLGACLVSEKAYGDFELIFDAKPDWPTDTGIMLRTPKKRGNVGYQILIDHRPEGGIGGFYGNGLAGFHQLPFRVHQVKDKNGNVTGLRAEKEKVAQKMTALTYFCTPEEFVKTWKFEQWNTFKVRCVGKIPVITVWINGTKISTVDTSKIVHEGYDAKKIAERIGGKGHLSFEVHNNGKMGWDRWGKGAVARWKNIFIKVL